MSGNHCITVSTVGCAPEVIKVYDSTLPSLLKRTIADLMFHGEKRITFNMQQQVGYSDCGLFATAAATAICHGLDPNAISEMRVHLRKAFRSKKVGVRQRT